MHVELEAVTGRGAPVSLRFEAGSVDEAMAIAARRGYVVLGAAGARAPHARLRLPRRSALDVGLFVQQLHGLLCAGLSVVESLDVLRRGSSGGAAAAIGALERRLREGRSLSRALEEDRAFSQLLIALVRASELTSDLPRTLERWLDHERELAAVRHRLLSTAIYPLLLAGVGAIVLLFLLLFVMPRFARVFAGLSGELPWSARAIVEWATFLRGGAAGWVGVGCVVLVAAAAGALAMPAWRAAALRSVMRWRPLDARLRTHFLARWYRAVGMLVSGGIPLASALGLATGVLPPALRRSGLAVEEGVLRGLSPAEAHAHAGMATPVAAQLLLAGERTGDLGAVLSRIAQFHEAETGRWLERSMRALEPIVMVLVGAGVGIVVVLMYLPIFDLASAIR